MLPLAGMLFNVVAGLVVDKAQDLAKDHVERMIDDVLPENRGRNQIRLSMKDGKLLPIEMTVKVRFDPNTQKLEVIT